MYIIEVMIISKGKLQYLLLLLFLSFVLLPIFTRVLAESPSLIVKFKDENLTPENIKKQAEDLEKKKNGSILDKIQFQIQNKKIDGMDILTLRDKLIETEKKAGVESQSLLYSKSTSNTAIKSIRTIKYAEKMNEKTVIQAYQDLPNVEWAVYDAPIKLFQVATVIPNDPRFSSQWDLHQSTDNDIDAPEAWGQMQGNGSITVADIDTGLDPIHQDLNRFVNTAEIPNNNIDDDNNGYIDDVYGWNFIDNNKDTSDFDGHGTHTAGTIGAKTNNGLGIAGIANVKILPLRIFTSGQVDERTSDVLKAIQYVSDNAQRFNIKVINMSFGATRARTDENSSDVCVAYEPILKNLYSKGVTAVAAAGNGDGRLAPETGIPYYQQAPAGCYGVISVGATKQDDQPAGFSNYGANMTLSAPGLSNPGITSTCPSNTYCEKNGTSMATPHVVGTAALMYYINPSMNHWTAKAIFSTKANNDPVQNETKPMGAGRLNAYKAVTAAKTAAVVGEPAPMTVTNITASFNSYNNPYYMQVNPQITVKKEATGDSASYVNVVASIKAPNGQVQTASAFTDANGIAALSKLFQTTSTNALVGTYTITIFSVAGDTNSYHPTLTSASIGSNGITNTPAPVSITPTKTPTPSPTSSINNTPTPTVSNTPTPTGNIQSCTDAAPSAGESLISQNVLTTASNTLSGSPSSYAVDGNTSTTWNAGNGATQWIELDLGQNRTISSLQLIVNQSPNGITNHVISLKNTNNQEISSRTLNCNTSWGQILNIKYSSPVSNVRYIRVTTAQSPSWVAWFEIKAYSPSTGPTNTPTPTSALISPTPTRTPTPTISSPCGTGFSCRTQRECYTLGGSPTGISCGTSLYCCYGK